MFIIYNMYPWKHATGYKIVVLSIIDQSLALYTIYYRVSAGIMGQMVL